MDIRQLRSFIAVAEEANLTRAAKRLHISQPPLTRQIQGLEAELGVALFHRTSRGVALTQAGEALLADAHHLRVLLEQATERAQMAGKGQFGRLDIGVFGTAMLGTLPRLLAAYTRANPNVKIVLHPGQTPAQVTALRQGRVSIVFERLLPDEPDIVIEPVAHEGMVLAMPAGHPLTALERVSVTALRDEPMIMPSAPDSRLANVGLDLCRAHGFEPKVAQRCADVMTGALLAVCGMGVMLAPASLAVVAMPGLTCRPIRSRVKAQMTLSCFYLRQDRSPTLQSLLATVREFRRAEGRGQNRLAFASANDRQDADVSGGKP